MLVDVPRRWRWRGHWRRWLAVGLFGAVLLYAVMWLAPDPSASGPPAAAPPASVRLRLATDAPAPEVAPCSEAMGPTPAHDPDEVQICGGAWVRLQADGMPDPADLTRAAGLPEARQQTIAALRAHPDPLSRASGLWLEMVGSSDRKAALLTAATGCDTGECQLAQQLARQADPEVAALRDSVVRMALSGNDPRVYALALHVCAGALRQVGACQLLSVAQWARLDPDNAAPWFAMLAAAKAANDPAAQDEALHHIATAKRSDQGHFAIPAAALAATPAGEDSTVAVWLLAAEALGLQAAVALPSYQPIVTFCKGPALLDANRRQTCSAIAETMVERSDTLIERMIGTVIGRQLGWPAERVDQLSGETTDYMTTAFAATEPTNASCAPFRRDLDRIRRQAVIGETGALRESVAASGKTPAAFIRQERASQEQRRQGAANSARLAPASAANGG